MVLNLKKKKWLTKVVTQFNPQLHCCSKQTESTRNNRSNLNERASCPGSYPLNVFLVRKAVLWRQHPFSSQVTRLAPTGQAEPRSHLQVPDAFLRAGSSNFGDGAQSNGVVESWTGGSQPTSRAEVSNQLAVQYGLTPDAALG